MEGIKQMVLPGTMWIAIGLLIVILLFDIFSPKSLQEGFKTLVGSKPVEVIDDSGNYFSSFFLKRGDVGINREEKGFINYPRYFNGYVDVQRLGFTHDYCRLVTPGTIADSFIACALAGTSGTPSTTYKSKTVADGLQLSRDDYMRDIYNENRYAYCRILKKNGSFQPLCLRAKEFGFSNKDEVDPSPPEEIVELLEFYDGCVAWLRLYDDMVDYTKNLIVSKGGGISIPEDPNPSVSNGLSFNGIDQFIRISDNPDLTLGRVISLRNVRAFSVWAYFDSFANNSHIFDFGNGAGDGNVFLGILGSGDIEGNTNEERPLLCGSQQNTLPNYPSGPHPCAETTPQNLMLLKANVNEYECRNFDVPPSGAVEESAKKTISKPTRATLLYEIWDGKQRKMRIKVNKVIPLKKWVHIAITAKTNDSYRPDISVYINGTVVHIEPSGHLPQTKGSSNNYLGKSNWSNQTSTYELRDELFNGKLFDFRIYNTVLSETKLKKTLVWGQNKLGIK